MAFTYCSKCDWSQDDFWDEVYNPVTVVQGWQEELLRGDLDGTFVEDPHVLTLREVIAMKFEACAKLIRGMAFRTEKDLPPDMECPVCGHSLEID